VLSQVFAAVQELAHLGACEVAEGAAWLQSELKKGTLGAAARMHGAGQLTQAVGSESCGEEVGFSGGLGEVLPVGRVGGGLGVGGGSGFCSTQALALGPIPATLGQGSALTSAKRVCCIPGMRQGAMPLVRLSLWGLETRRDGDPPTCGGLSAGGGLGGRIPRGLLPRFSS
jgi:hypothetical protein